MNGNKGLFSFSNVLPGAIKGIVMTINVCKNNACIANSIAGVSKLVLEVIRSVNSYCQGQPKSTEVCSHWLFHEL